MTIDKLMDAYDTFVEALPKIADLAVTIEPFTRSTAAEITALEQLLHVRVPDDLRRFWTRGYHNVGIEDGKAVIGAQRFVDAKGAMAQAKISLGLAHDEADDVIKRWDASGIPFTADEEYCLVDMSKAGAGRVFQNRTDGEPEKAPIAATFTKYFEAWLASGCFSYGNADAKVFSRYWHRVDKLVRIRITPEHNDWLLHVGRWYGNAKFPAA